MDPESSRLVDAKVRAGGVRVIFLVDATGSMGNYCKSVGSTLKQILAMLDVLFEGAAAVDIVAYEDYCDGDRVIRATSRDGGRAELETFACSLKAGGGGDTPEAVKTALNRVIEQLRKDNAVDAGASARTIVVHYTDAPPHHKSSGSSEANIKAEQKALGGKSPGFDWTEICKSFCEMSTQVFTFLKNNISQQTQSFMALLGSVVILPDTVPAVITEYTMGVLLQIMGQPFDGSINCLNKMELRDKKCDENSPCFLEALALSHKAQRGTFDAHPSFVKDLKSLITRFSGSEEFQDVVYTALKSLLVPENVLSLTYNSVLGLLWRALCKRREDPRTLALCDSLSSCVQVLQGSERSKLQSWVDESYNQLEDIKLIITAVQDPLALGVLVMDVETADLPSKEDMRSILHAPTPGVLKKVQSLLARLFVVQTGSLPRNSSEDAPMYLPLGMKDKDLFSALSHLISPGLLLSLRPAAMLAILAFLSNSPVLRPRAERFLQAWKGKWIPPVAKAKEYPEIFNAEFVKLLVRIPEFLTEDERVFYDRLNLIIRIRRAASLRLPVKVGFSPSITDLKPDTKIPCSSCGHRRSFTLMVDGICGLCLKDPTASKTHPEPSDDRSHMVECRTCRALYAVVDTQALKVKPKCHYCRSPETALTVCCISCENKFCAATASDRIEGFICQCCTHTPIDSLPHREVQLADLMRENPELIGCLGFSPARQDLIFDRMSLYKLWMCHGESQLLGAELKVETLRWAGKLVKEVATLISCLRESVFKGSLQETCSLCFEDRPLSRVESACGHCSNLTCTDCLKNWYGKLAPGRLYVPSEGLCPFCKRTPKVKTLRAFNAVACRLQGRRSLVLRADMHYAWCRSCFKIKDLVPRECSHEAPQIDNFECEDCQSAKLLSTEEALSKAKPCPGCKSPCIKISGCDHISCPVCSIHWCWQCMNQFPREEIYTHMEAAHGGIGLDDAADFDED